MAVESKATATMTPAHDRASFWHLRPSATSVSDHAFAGRIGGNQEFVASDEDLLKKQPDAVCCLKSGYLSRLTTSLGSHLPPQRLSQPSRLPQRRAMAYGHDRGLGYLHPHRLLWCWRVWPDPASALRDHLWHHTLRRATKHIGLMLFIFSAGPASGGHLNPTITIATFFAGLCSLPRAVLYIVAQCSGAIIAGYWLKLGLGDDAYFPHVRSSRLQDRRNRTKLCDRASYQAAPSILPSSRKARSLSWNSSSRKPPSSQPSA